jgi:iron complex transport system permease protein
MQKPMNKILLFLLPIVTAFFALCIGRYFVAPMQVLAVFKKQIFHMLITIPPIDLSVIMNIRIPRVLLALLVGSGLSVAGASFQSLFSNPLATPDTLGVAAGAAFGAALGLLHTENMFLVQLLAVLFGIVAVLITYKISQVRNQSNILMIVLAGIVTSSFFQALISLIKFVADPETKLPSITYWLMGSMTAVSYKTLLLGTPFIILGILILYLLRWKLNAVSLNEDESKSMGINVKLLRWGIIGAATLITASSVSMCGQVGWIGLLIPHSARMIGGANNKNVIPISICLGATFMIIIDTLARTATAAEIPLSILTAMIGAPFFAWLLKKTGGGWI